MQYCAGYLDNDLGITQNDTDYLDQNLENVRNRADYLDTNLENVQNGADCEENGLENMQNSVTCLYQCCKFGNYSSRLSAIITNAVVQSLHVLGIDQYLI